MNILEYERRVKLYVSVDSKGFVSDRQLVEAFKDTKIFKHLLDHNDVKTRFLLSPFVSCFASGSHLKTERGLARQQTKTRSQKLGQL
mmetsp:Transcript_10229/g.12037  ORF Transcript_10229/g.12037 Transcript_10229/m.12037 type:complete len:87 (+) Transcript_10229:72-332(+)